MIVWRGSLPALIYPPRVRVRVDTFSGLSESSSDRTLFSSRSADSRMSASWGVVFGLGEPGRTRWLEKPPDPSAMYAHEPKKESCALRHVVGVT